MSFNDSGPPAGRRRKLVLRKIPAPGPLPVVKPPQKSLPFVSVDASAEAEAAAAITSLPPRGMASLEPQRTVADSPRALAQGGVRGSRPQPDEIPAAYRARLPSQVPFRAPPYEAPPSETGTRATVAPTATSARPAGMAREHVGSPWIRFARASTRGSTLLVAGGCVVALAIFATLGLEVGERSGRPAAASLQAVSQATAETKASVPVPSQAQKLVPSVTHPSSEQAAKATATEAERTTPIATTPRVVRTMAAVAPAAAPEKTPTTPAPAMSGWAIAQAPTAQPSSPSDTNAQAARSAVDPAASAATSAAVAPEIPPTPAPTVDPLVQAVREDIREEEARTK